jgi:hypothetical protein
MFSTDALKLGMAVLLIIAADGKMAQVGMVAIH